MRLVKDEDGRLDGLKVCLVVAEDVSVGATPDALIRELKEVSAMRAREDIPEALRDSIRGALRSGGYKPAGRNKPASEYLVRTAREGNVPVINNLVDCNNLLSLETGLPISLLDAGPIGETAFVRIAREGESYVFNSGGQEMDLAGLACICAGSAGMPLGNPVKDSMAGKIQDGTTMVAGFIYAPASYGDTALEAAGKRFAVLLQTYGGPGAQAEHLGIL